MPSLTSAHIRLFAGVDVGGTKTEVVLVDDDGLEWSRVRVATVTGARGVVASVTSAIAIARESIPPHLQRLPLEAIGVGTPGAVEAATGVVARSVNLDVEQLPLGELLAAELSCAVHVDNDVNLAAFGLARSMSPPARSLAFINLGTGLGVGIVVDGAVWRGVTGAAGEIGHLCFDPLGPRCECGMRGCLELYASGSGLLREAGGEPVDDLFRRARDRTSDAARIVDRFAAALAETIRIVVQTYDPEVVALGGGVFASHREFMPGVDAILEGWDAASAFVASLRIRERVGVVDRDQAIASTGAGLWAAQQHGAGVVHAVERIRDDRARGDTDE